MVELGKTIPSHAEQGINLIVLEVDYSFDFQSHPELRQGTKYITRDGARRFARICRDHGIRLIPEFQSLGHQSWASSTFPLLTRYPELDLTPGAFPDNEDIYCREWDPTNPRVNGIVFPQPVRLSESALLRSIAYKIGAVASDVSEKRFVVHKATGRSITLATPSPKYPAMNGAGTLVNGVTGSTSYTDGQWVGAEGTYVEAQIDLGVPTQVS